MQWKESMATGVNYVDEQNKKLVEELDGITRMLYATKKCDEKTVKKLKDSFKANFEFQEKFMEKYGYEGFFQHKYQHERCIKDLEGQIDALYADETGGGVNGLNTFLMQWVIRHFGMYDKEFSEFARLHQMQELNAESRSKSAARRIKKEGKTIRERRGLAPIQHNDENEGGRKY